MAAETISKQITDKIQAKKDKVDKIRYGKVLFTIQDGRVITAEYTESDRS